MSHDNWRLCTSLTETFEYSEGSRERRTFCEGGRGKGCTLEKRKSTTLETAP